MSSSRLVAGILALLGSVCGAVAASAAPPAAPATIAPFGAIDGGAVSFTWNGVAGATWYQIWVDDAVQSAVLRPWYTAAGAGCTGGGTCTATVSAGLAAGRAKWWVRGWNAEGNGPWSVGRGFSVENRPVAWQLPIPDGERLQLVYDGEGVLDRETGLVWERQPATYTGSYTTVHQYCLGRYHGSSPRRYGWRLPSLQEMQSLRAGAAAGLDLPAGHPFIGIAPDDRFWTTTPFAGSTDFNYHARFEGGVAFGGGASHSLAYRHWCVRGIPTPPE